MPLTRTHKFAAVSGSPRYNPVYPILICFCAKHPRRRARFEFVGEIARRVEDDVRQGRCWPAPDVAGALFHRLPICEPIKYRDKNNRGQRVEKREIHYRCNLA